MPPKAPNLKFKPKLVKETENDGPKTEKDELSKAQLERLEKIQTATVDHPNTATSSKVQDEPNKATHGGKRTKLSEHHNPTSNTIEDEEEDRRLVRRTPQGGGDIDLYAVPSHAERLPRNTVHDLIADCHNNEQNAQTDRKVSTIFPIPLASGVRHPPTSSDEATASNGQGNLEDRGTEFLRAHGAEELHSYESNKQFFENVIRPNLESDNSPQSHQNLFWIQMPKFQMNNEADLFYSGESTANSSGKEIGELVVLKSGRMLMKINGVYYDTSVCGSPGDDHGSPLTTVVAEQPSVNNTSHTAAVEPNYDLLEFDTLKYKLICTPKLNES